MSCHFLLENIEFTKVSSRSIMNKTTCRSFSLLILLISAFSLTLSAQTPQFMSVDEVRPGMKGIGKTVFQGTKIEQFDVELLGVLKNFAPKQDMILARLSGGPIARTGVIAGMSGSPVYIDGKLLGAVAFSFPYATEPIAGIQPIQQMLGLLDQKNPTPPKQIAQGAADGSGNGGVLLSESPTAFVYNQLQKVAEGTPLHQLLMPQSLLSAGSGGTSAPNAAALRRDAGSASTVCAVLLRVWIYSGSRWRRWKRTKSRCYAEQA